MREENTVWIIVNLFNEPLSAYEPMTKAEAEKVIANEAAKGWQVYMREVKS